MTVDLGHAIGYLPFPLGVTATAEHVVVQLNAAGRRLLGDVVGRPLRETLPDPGLLDTLDAAFRNGLPGTAVLATPAVTVGCAPIRDGVLLHLTPGDTPSADTRVRAVALQRLTGELSGAATPSEIGRLVVTTSGRLLGAEGAGVYARAGADMLTAVHTTGWATGFGERYGRIPIVRGRPLSDAVLDGVPVWVENAEQWRLRYPDMAPAGTADGFQATACLPMRVEDRDLGALVFSFRTPRAFAGDERDYLLAVAALCAQALDRARLLTAEREARTWAERQLDRMSFLATASRLVQSPQSVEERLQRLADLAVPVVADWCAVHLVRDDRVDQVAVAHSDPAKLEFVERLQERYPTDPAAPSGPIHVSRTGEAALVRDISDTMLAAAAVDEEHLELLRSIGMRSALVVPLLVRGRSIGAVTLVHAESGERFDDADLAFATQLAANAAIALDNALLDAQQRDIVQVLQTALLPAALPSVPGLRLAARYRPQSDSHVDVQVGGDLYDVVAGAAPGVWGVVVADVCGKGPEAAALTALIRHTVRAEIAHDLGPGEVATRLNRAMLHAADGPARFATMVHGQVTVGGDGGDGVTVRLVNAGHPPPILLRGGRAEAVPDHGTVLGVFPRIALSEIVVRLGRGEMMVLYTDGVTEARSVDGLYGPERLARFLTAPGLTTAEAVADALLADVTAFQRGRLRDDVAILVLQAAS